MKKFWRMALTVLLSASFILAGCQSSAPTTAVNGKPVKIALIVKSVDSEYWLNVKAGAEKAAKDLGVQLTFQGPSTETDIAGQVSIVENAISQQVSGIVLAASDTKALVPPVEKAVNAKIPVVTIDSGIDSDKPVSFIATDNEAAAKTAAKTLAELAGKKGKVAVVNFVPGAATAVMRENGFKEGLKEFPEMSLSTIQYSDSDKAKALAKTDDILTANPDTVGIFGANNRSALGVAQSVKQKGLAGKVKVVGFDADPDEIKALEEGTIQALIVQNPYKMGYEGVVNTLKAIKGEPVEKRIDTGVTVVTKENLHSPEVQQVLNPQK